MKYKFIGTYHCFCGLHLKIIRKMLSCENEHHGQFRIVCKARGLDHANELTKDLGHKVFRRDYTSETGNEKELKAFEENPRVTYIISYMYRDKFLTDIELNKIIELIEENKT
jgi:hypothetical protein